MTTLIPQLTYRTLGNSGLRVSNMALGAMTFGTEWGWGADRAEAQAMFDLFVEAGGNLFDTADLYTNGTSETWLGAFIAARGMRDRAVIATKFSYNADPDNPNAGGNGRKNIMRAVEGSLRRLGTDYIDLYILHSWDRVTPADEVMRALDDLTRSGKILHIGLSDIPAWYASRAQTLAELRGLAPVVALQLEYSLAERSMEHEFVALGTEHGMGILAWSPLASGLLTGKYRSNATDGRLATLASSGNPAFAKVTDRTPAILGALEDIAKETGRGLSEVALAWVAARPGVASVILGARNQYQLAANLNATTLSLTPEMMDRLNTASAVRQPFPYYFFGPEIQGMIHGTRVVEKDRPGYRPVLRSTGGGAGVQAKD